MAYSAWPFAAPNSWNETPARPIIRSTVEDGQPKVRRRFTKIWFNYETSFRLLWSEHQAFWDFYNLDCQGGASPFTINHPITGASLIVRFAAEPSVSSGVATMPTFDISCKLERMFS